MTIRDISSETGFLIGFSISMILYGVYCSLFALTLFTRRLCKSNSPLVTGAIIALFVVCTIIMALHMVICYYGFIQPPPTKRATGFFVDPFQPRQDWFPVRDVLVLLSNLIAECLLIWRLYTVWLGNWKIMIVPAIGMLVVISTGIVSVVMEFIVYLSPPQRARDLLPSLNHAIPTGWLSILLNNLFCTVLIIWRLWRISRSSKGHATARLANPAVSALIESGGLYTGVMLCTAILAATGTHGVKRVFVLLMTVVIGITSTSIVFRLNLIAFQKPSRPVQNDVSTVQFVPSSATVGYFDPNEGREVHTEVGIETIPEPVSFARPSISEFAKPTRGDVADDQMSDVGRELEKFPNSLTT